ncbi:Rho GTPase activation protein [Dioscorea alata]|uniref:Rho GTPase activation protein n=1 Tax=Dioscorea alata TaxID=55571 RepID=A0ACB7VCG5_DIOAL|nr:Rho GTPase activation protein [Dioscorea alata]
MTAVLQSPSHIPSSSSSPLSCSVNDGGRGLLRRETVEEEEEEGERKGDEDQLSLLAFVVTVLRKSLAGCRTEGGEEDLRSMEIGWPTNVQHVAHVTFDRFHGFLGLPVEFEPEVLRRAPSASTNVFGVSTASMQCSYDSRGNSVPTILLLMQRRLYEQGGLQAEGIFRINPGNSQEELVRDQLSNGIVPDNIDVHCLAGLIKAWFRELPTGVLDPLTPEQVMQCQSEDDCTQLVKLLPPSEAALLDWAVNLMADIVQEEQRNKMNARNVAMVFAPNMTQMADPLTALMYAVQVMNFLKMLIHKALKERQEPFLEEASVPPPGPSDGDNHQSPQLPLDASNKEHAEQEFIPEKPFLKKTTQPLEESFIADDAVGAYPTSHENSISQETDECSHEVPTCTDGAADEPTHAVVGPKMSRMNSRKKKGQSSYVNHKKGSKKGNGQSVRSVPAEKTRGISIVSRINSKVERAEAWR